MPRAAATRLLPLLCSVLRETATALITMLLLLLVVLLSPFVRDAEGAAVQVLPVHLQHWVRDSQAPWKVMDAFHALLGGVGLLVTHPLTLAQLLCEVLGGGGRALRREWSVVHLNYCSNVISWYPAHVEQPQTAPALVFVHGGAWSHGAPWLYALFARQLAAREGWNVGVVGYHNWPTAGARAQSEEVGRGIRWLLDGGAEQGRRGTAAAGRVRFDRSRVALLGHSSGAHILLLWLLSRRRRSSGPSSSLAPVRAVVGYAGPYDIRSHYSWEARRGVAQISALQPACGGCAGRAFEQVSPTAVRRDRGGLGDTGGDGGGGVRSSLHAAHETPPTPHDALLCRSCGRMRTAARRTMRGPCRPCFSCTDATIPPCRYLRRRSSWTAGSGGLLGRRALPVLIATCR